MLVSHRKRFIYTKTGKTAGTSVEVFFEPYCMKEGEWAFSESRPEYVSEAGIIGFRGDPAQRTGAKWWNHMSAAAIKSQLGDELWNAYFKFCVVRNPFDKVVSAFHFFGKPQLNLSTPEQATGTTGSEDEQTRTLQQAFEAWLDAGWLPIDRDRYLIDGKFCMDDVIRYESLQEGLQRVCTRLQIPFGADWLQKLKTGIRPKVPIKHYYSERALDIVTQAYRFELDAFGYSFPG